MSKHSVSVEHTIWASRAISSGIGSIPSDAQAHGELLCLLASLLFFLRIPHSISFPHVRRIRQQYLDKVGHHMIYDLNTKNLYYAELGRGAFVKNDAWSKKAELKVRKDGLQNGLVCTSSPYSRSNFKPNWQLMDKVHTAGARLVMLGSAPLESAYVAEGKLSLYYEKGLKPWDIAAATLIVTEAGGTATSLEGNFNILHPQTFICGNKSIVSKFLQLVQGK